MSEIKKTEEEIKKEEDQKKANDIQNEGFKNFWIMFGSSLGGIFLGSILIFLGYKFLGYELLSIIGSILVILSVILFIASFWYLSAYNVGK
jgi:hypothetical protein